MSNLKGTTFSNIFIQALQIFFISNRPPNLNLDTLLDNRLLSSITPVFSRGDKKASPFWLEEGLAKHPLSIVVLISDAWIARMGDLWSCRYNNKNNHRKKDDKLCLCSLHKNKETGRATTSVFQPNSLPCFHRIKKNQPVPDRNGLDGFNNRRFN